MYKYHYLGKIHWSSSDNALISSGPSQIHFDEVTDSMLPPYALHESLHAEIISLFKLQDET
jgi:hypothetical protein